MALQPLNGGDNLTFAGLLRYTWARSACDLIRRAEADPMGMRDEAVSGWPSI